MCQDVGPPAGGLALEVPAVHAPLATAAVAGASHNVGIALFLLPAHTDTRTRTHADTHAQMRVWGTSSLGESHRGLFAHSLTSGRQHTATVLTRMELLEEQPHMACTGEGLLGSKQPRRAKCCC